MVARAIAAVLSVAAVAVVLSEDQTTPYAAVPRGTATTDGVLAVEWGGATGFPLCHLVRGQGVPWQQVPTARVMWDETALYVAVEVPLGEGGPVAKAQGRDMAVWDDDAAEVFLQPPGAGAYLQFISNAAGSVYDGRGRDGTWDANWHAAARVGPHGGTLRLKMCAGSAALVRVRPPDGK